VSVSHVLWSGYVDLYHRYDSAKNVEYFKSHVRSAYAAGNGRQVWITEFGPSGSSKLLFRGASLYLGVVVWIMIWT
jgi:hypothetical protein